MSTGRNGAFEMTEVADQFLIVSESTAVPAPLALDALSFTLNRPVASGAPDMTPVEEFTTSPVGKPVAANLVGLFVAVIL